MLAFIIITVHVYDHDALAQKYILFENQLILYIPQRIFLSTLLRLI